jgi:spermidine synthase
MKIYNGILIHRHHVGDNNLDVVDDGPFRSLHFNSLSIQSRMQRSEPERLVLEYTQAMMLALAYQMAPRHALLIGLGGGSQARFLLKNFPDCQVDVVEIEPAVTELAHRFFALPHSERLQVHHMDAEAYIGQLEHRPLYDLILIDAFDQSGPVEAVFNAEFLKALRALMTPDAVCAINMWKTDAREYAALCYTVEESLRAPVYDVALSEDPENVVLLIPLQAREGKTLLRNSKKLEKQTGLKLVKHLNNLAKLEIPAAR